MSYFPGQGQQHGYPPPQPNYGPPPPNYGPSPPQNYGPPPQGYPPPQPQYPLVSLPVNPMIPLPPAAVLFRFFMIEWALSTKLAIDSSHRPQGPPPPQGYPAYPQQLPSPQSSGYAYTPPPPDPRQYNNGGFPQVISWNHFCRSQAGLTGWKQAPPAGYGYGPPAPGGPQYGGRPGELDMTTQPNFRALPIHHRPADGEYKRIRARESFCTTSAAPSDAELWRWCPTRVRISIFSLHRQA